MKLALGTAQFGLSYGIANSSGKISRGDAKEIILEAKKYGVDTIDTAIAYGDSEECLGEAGVSGFKIVTKLPAVPDDIGNVKNWVIQQVEESLLRLKVDRIYGLMLHRPLQLAGPRGEEIREAIEHLRNAAKFHKFGVSIYSASELETVMTTCKLDIIQAPISIIDRRLEDSGLLKRLKSLGIEIHARSVFLQGLLLTPKAELQPRFARWSIIWDRWESWLRDHSLNALEACVWYVQSRPEIDRVVVGVDSLSQFQEIANHSKEELGNIDFPDIACGDEMLVNPSNWTKLESKV